MKETFKKLGDALNYAKEQSGKGLVLVKKDLYSTDIIVDDVQKLVSTQVLECTFFRRIKSIWPETHIEYMRE